MDRHRYSNSDNNSFMVLTKSLSNITCSLNHLKIVGVFACFEIYCYSFKAQPSFNYLCKSRFRHSWHNSNNVPNK
jgi:hypothetical protein